MVVLWQWHYTSVTLTYRYSCVSCNNKCIHALPQKNPPIKAWKKIRSGLKHTRLIHPQTKMFFPASIQWEELRMVNFWHRTLLP